MTTSIIPPGSLAQKIWGYLDSTEGKSSQLWQAGLEKLVKTSTKSSDRLAQEAASSDHGATISPLVNTDRKGGAFPIMLQQFRRAIGVAIVWGNT